jgi:hypothetical protein
LQLYSAGLEIRRAKVSKIGRKSRKGEKLVGGFGTGWQGFQTPKGGVRNRFREFPKLKKGEFGTRNKKSPRRGLFAATGFSWKE